MELSTYNLETLGSHALGHYKAAEKHKEKSEQQYISAGIYLKEANKRCLKTRGLSFRKFLIDHCQISYSRAYEVIAIADGTKTVEEVRERSNQSSKASHAKTRTEAKAYREHVHCSADKQPEKPNENNDSYNEVIEEAEKHGEDESTRLRKVLTSCINKATLQQLQAMERAYNGS